MTEEGGHGEIKSSHPGSAKDVPILNLEVLPKTFNVFHQIPGRVLFQACTPIPPPNGSAALSKRAAFVHARKRLSSSPLVQEDDLARDPLSEGCFDGKDKLLDLILIGVEKAAIFLIASATGTTCRGLSKMSLFGTISARDLTMEEDDCRQSRS